MLLLFLMGGIMCVEATLHYMTIADDYVSVKLQLQCSCEQHVVSSCLTMII